MITFACSEGRQQARAVFYCTIAWVGERRGTTRHEMSALSSDVSSAVKKAVKEARRRTPAASA
jgi:hypothetical protein